MKWVSSALPEGSTTDVAGRSRLLKTGQVTDGDSLSRTFPEQHVQRVFSEEEAIVLEAQLERAADPVASVEASPAIEHNV